MLQYLIFAYFLPYDISSTTTKSMYMYYLLISPYLRLCQIYDINDIMQIQNRSEELLEILVRADLDLAIANSSESDIVTLCGH